MFDKPRSQYPRGQAFSHAERFSFANDAAPLTAANESYSGTGMSTGARILAACGVFMFCATLTGIGALVVPETTRYEARVLAVIPEDVAGARASMGEVVRYASSHFGTEAVRAPANSEFGTVAVDSIAVRQEEQAPVLLISSDIPHASLATATVDYFTRQLTDQPPPDPGIADARRALEVTLDQAQLDLQEFEDGLNNDQAEPQAMQGVNDLGELRRTAEAARERAVAASKLKLSSVLAGSADESIITPTLAALVDQYTTASTELDSLTESLGPKHPQYLSAKAARAAVEDKINREIARIVQMTRKETQSATAAQMQAEESHKEISGKQNAVEEKHAQLKQTVVAAAANLDDFERAQEPVPPARFRLISPATAMQEPMFDRIMIVFAGLAAAALVALAVFGLTARGSRQRAAYSPMVAPELDFAEPPKAAERSMLEAFETLEEYWPDTGRQEEMPSAANDEPAQMIDPQVRLLATRLAALRKRVSQAAYAGSEPTMEETLAEMRRLRQKVRNLSAEKRQRSY